jgi:RNase adaptor protein for sRNA GlmZ degradation
MYFPAKNNDEALYIITELRNAWAKAFNLESEGALTMAIDTFGSRARDNHIANCLSNHIKSRRQVAQKFAIAKANLQTRQKFYMN